MTELPTGTVTMLFSDIEGSTLLLSRLGPAYAEALDAQRNVLREAWAAHGGTEMGTEGDSFFVVFPTAPDAVAAAAHAQQEQARYPWPGGQPVRVRMGIHTGSPTVHGGGYVGMDVHRAARMAGAAHGGQVVVSSATAELVRADLNTGVHLRDLGSHQLKDIPNMVHLFQLNIDGLQVDFPPLKTLGAVSSLPVPTTPLVGRDGELAELTALLRSPGVRLVTLTGPGGSGKTRLSIGVAQRLTGVFPDGVYFVPLAAVTNPDVMWTSIAEVLDVPPEGRLSLFDYLAHRSALFVLDNLEQLPGADGVVAELMDAASQVVIIATSRRPLNITGELQHAVPPLELPDNAASADDARRSGAVQMFVHHARAVKATFSLTPENVTDVVAICTRLDGLPLAIELAAARVKLLSPHAVVSRLGKALDITASGSRGPSRQKTLRDTINWSYALLTGEQQAFFRRLGVFAGGADLDDIATVASDPANGIDPLDMVAGLLDASLVMIDEEGTGEPRFGMLETIRAYAQDELRAVAELDAVRRTHAQHYLTVAQRLCRQIRTGGRDGIVAARRRFELDVGNFREALGWALPSGGSDEISPDVQLGLRLAAELSWSWWEVGYYTEARYWLGRAITLAGEQNTPELGRCLGTLARFSTVLGEQSAAREYATHSVAVLRRTGNEEELSTALLWLGGIEESLGDFEAARDAVEEAVALARGIDHKPIVSWGLRDLATLEFRTGNLERRLELERASLVVSHESGDDIDVLRARHNIACTLRLLGRLDDAREQILELVPPMVQLGQPDGRTSLAEDFAALLVDLGDHVRAVRLIGASDANRERNGTRRSPTQEAEVHAPFAEARAALPPDVWDHEYQLGYSMTVEDALTEAYAADAPA
jgi:predicted ATPase/class 3 adenylate cyclase